MLTLEAVVDWEQTLHLAAVAEVAEQGPLVVLHLLGLLVPVVTLLLKVRRREIR